MRKKLVLESLTALSIAIFVLAAYTNLAFAVTTNTEHLNAGGTVLIDVPGHPKILVVAMHMDRSDFYKGSADRINLFVPGKPLIAYEDNPERKAFSDQVGGGPPGTRPLVEKWQIQTFRICKTVFICWTIPLTLALATATTPEVTLPPGCLVLRGYGDAKVSDSVTPFPLTGWTMASHVTGYDAKATLFCPSWHYYGPASETATPSVQTDGTAIWTRA